MTLTGNLEQKFKKSLYPRIRPGPSQAEHLSEADLLFFQYCCKHNVIEPTSNNLDHDQKNYVTVERVLCIKRTMDLNGFILDYRLAMSTKTVPQTRAIAHPQTGT